MLKITAEHFVKEDSLPQFMELSRRLAEKTVKSDQGCISYSMYQDINDPLHCTFIEEWETKELLDKHMQAAHCVELIPKIGECCSRPTVIALYEKLF